MSAANATQLRSLNVAVIGKPNTGKSTLFTALSGIRVQTGNYPGVTVERKVGRVRHQDRELRFIDVPGTYSLTPRTIDERITIDLLENGDPQLGPVDVILCVVDATQLERGLFLVSQLQRLGRPLILALNMFDVVQSRGIEIDTLELGRRLGNVPVIPTVAPRRKGIPELITALTTLGDQVQGGADPETPPSLPEDAAGRYAWAEGIASAVVKHTKVHHNWSDRIDRILTGRFTGLIVFLMVMFAVFQAIFTWVGPVMEVCEAAQGAVSEFVVQSMSPGPLRSLIVDGVIAGVGGVLVFVPQIALLFLLLGILEDTGYMARAALMTDRLMARFGLSGKSFLPLMSSFACAVPGILATRVIENRRDRFITILVAPLMSCSARLPVYLLLIGAFVPSIAWAGGFISLKGLVLLAMLSLGALVAIPVAWLLGRTFFRGQPGAFLLELPDYKRPSLRTVLWKSYDGTKEFVVRAGTLIFATAIVVWAAGYFPGDHTRQHSLQAKLQTLGEIDAPQREELQQELNVVSQQLIEQSFLGRAGRVIEPVVRPCGWDWRIGTAVIASFPAREVVIATMGTIFSLGSDVDEQDQGLRSALAHARWPDGSPLITTPVALSIMVFFALCAQCVSTLVVIRRETRSWWWPTFCFVYMTTLAYAAACLTYQLGAYLMT